MSKIPETYQCDAPGCTHIKGEQNHWFILLIPSIGTIGIAVPMFSVYRWVEAGIRGSQDAKHACGEACLLKLISIFLKHPVEIR